MQFPDFLGYVKRMEKVEAGFPKFLQGVLAKGLARHQILFACLLALFLAKVDLYRVDVTYVFFSFVASFALDKIGISLGGSGFC